MPSITEKHNTSIKGIFLSTMMSRLYAKFSWEIRNSKAINPKALNSFFGSTFSLNKKQTRKLLNLLCMEGACERNRRGYKLNLGEKDTAPIFYS